MKTLLMTIGLMAACARTGYAVEYRTLNDSTPAITLSPTDVVEIVGTIASLSNTGTAVQSDLVQVRFEGGDYFGMRVTPGQIFTSLSQIVRSSSTSGPVTIKITHANELNVVAPTSLLVLPEGSTGNYNIVVETSDDTTTWTPFHSQTVSATDAKRFFRTRIVKAQ